MKTYRILTILAAALFLGVSPAHRACGEHGLFRGTDYGPGSSTSSDKGQWPGTWPKELEPLRAQARTFYSLTQIQEAVHEIRFTKRADFERVWPALLKLKTPGAPLTLYLTDSPLPGRMGVWFAKGVPVVRIYAPEEYCLWPTALPPLGEPKEKLIKEGRMLKCGPPWPADIVGTNGVLPEWVRATRAADGKLRWTAADFAADMKELKDCRVPHPLAVDGCVHRARIDLGLVADGLVIDLDKLQFPPETVTHDERIKIPKPPAEHVTAADLPCGAAVEGIQLRVRANKAQWKVGETLPGGTAKARTPPFVAAAPRPSQIDTTPRVGTSESVSARVPPPAMRFAVSAIVRAKMLSLENNVLACEVIRVIYGRVSGKAVRVAATDTEESVRNLLRQGARESKKEVLEPSAAEVRAAVVQENRFVVGREVILFLRRPMEGTNPVVWLPGGMSWGFPEHPLDKQEKEIVEEIKTGAYLRPDTLTGKLEAYELGPYTVRSERVVRARLVKIGETSAQWQVSGVLCVAPPPGQGPGSASAGNHPAGALQPEKLATISVDMATWRLRAETIVRYRAAQQPGTAVKEEDIRVEYARLLKDELPPGREAILFIRPREKPADGTVYKLIGILYGDAGKANRLDQFDKAIREFREHLGLGLQREE